MCLKHNKVYLITGVLLETFDPYVSRTFTFGFVAFDIIVGYDIECACDFYGHYKEQ